MSSREYIQQQDLHILRTMNDSKAREISRLESELTTLKARLAEADKAVIEACEYLEVSELETIGSGSYLHKQLRDYLTKWEVSDA